MTDEVRLLVLNCEYPPIGGGAARATKYILKELDGYPVRWTLVTASPDNTRRTERQGEKGRIDYLAVRKKNLYYWTARELISYAAAALGHVRRLEAAGERYDLCHAFFTVPAGAVAMLGGGRRPYIVSLRGSDVPGRSGRFVWFYRLFGFALKMIWRRARAVAANSEELKELAESTDAGVGIEVIPNGVDTGKFHPDAGRRQPFTILTVGRLLAGKDLTTIVRATAIVRERFPQTRLLVVGDGPQREGLARTARELGIEGQVEFRSWVSWEDIDDIYRQAGVFALTSLREGMSNTVLEAMASGLPIVASAAALSGIEAAGAAVVTPGDAREAAEAIGRYFGDEALRERASRASREAADRYSWRSTARSYYDIYVRVAGKDGGMRRS